MSSGPPTQREGYSLRLRRNRAVNNHISSSSSSTPSVILDDQQSTSSASTNQGRDSRDSISRERGGEGNKSHRLVNPPSSRGGGGGKSVKMSKSADSRQPPTERLVSLTPSGSSSSSTSLNDGSEDEDESPFSLVDEKECADEDLDTAATPEEETSPEASAPPRRFANSDRSDMVKFLYTDGGTDANRGLKYQQQVHSLYAKYDKRGGSASPTMSTHHKSAASKPVTGHANFSMDDDDDQDDEDDAGEMNPLGDTEVLFERGGISSPLLPTSAGRQLNALSRGRRSRSSSSTSSGHPGDHETMLAIAIQVFIPFLIAGFGMVGAGLVLDLVQHWDVFREISEIFILVPALLGLKGNLEMTLASRLSTQANLGRLNTWKDQYYATSGNIALLQCQATVVGFLAALFAIVMDWLPEGEFNMSHAILLCGSSLLTASVASFVLGFIMIAVVIASHKCNVNPDNIATPIAASLGDLTTLYLLANISNLLYYSIDSSLWLCVVVIIAYLALIPIWAYISHNNSFTNEVLYNGWTPVITGMAISSFGGLILDFAVRRFKGIAVFQPVINGVGGNLVAVQASRLSTYLHQRSKLGTLPKSDSKLCLNPFSTIFSGTIHSRTVRVLLLMVLPGQLIFIFAIQVLHAGHTSITPLFLVVYCVAAVIQVFLLLYIAHIMILHMWRRRIDPDNSAIPYLTALGDLIGGALLALSFLFLFSVSDGDEDVGH